MARWSARPCGAGPTLSRSLNRSVLLRQFALDRGDQAGVVGRGVGGEAGGDLAVLADQELLEVPEHAGLRVGAHAEALQALAEGGAFAGDGRMLLDHLLVQGMGVGAGDRD